MSRLLPAAWLLGAFLAACRSGPAAEGRFGAPDSSRTAAVVAYDRGETLYDRDEFDSAAAVLSDAVQLARASSDTRTEARALTLLGITAWRTARYDRARSYGDSALALKHRYAHRGDLFLSYNSLGLLAWNEGRLLDAVTWFDSASAAAEELDRPEDVGKAAGNRALVEVELGEFRAAENGFEKMLAAGTSSGNRRLQGNAFTNLGMLAVRVGNPAGALAPLDSALRLYRSLDYSIGIQAALAQLGTARAALGDVAVAFALFDSALAIARAKQLDQEVAATLETVAALHAWAGEPRRALASYAEAQTINRRLGLALEEASDLRDQAELYRALGEQTSAIQSARQALRIHREAGAAPEELKDLLAIADAAHAAGDMQLAGNSIGSARGMADRLGIASARAEVALADARHAMHAGAPKRVLEILRKTGADLSATGAGTEWIAHDLAAEAWIALDRRDSAIAEARLAVAAVERVRGTLAGGVQRTEFLAGRGSAYARLMESLLLAGRTAEAFAVADRMRGRSMFDHLASRRNAAETPGLARLAHRDLLLRRTAALEERVKQLDADDSDGLASGASAARSQLLAELEAARRAVDQEPLPHQDQVDPILIQRSLGIDEALAAFTVTDARTHLFLIRKDSISHFDIPIGNRELAARVRLARDLVARPQSGPPPPVLGALDSILFGGARAHGALRGVGHMIIVPHSSLAYLPFAALRESGSGRYVAQRTVISLVPSAASVAEMRRRPRQLNALSKAAVFAPVPEGLPASRQEADAVRARFSGAREFLADAATEEQVVRALSDSGIVHIASHAIMNPANPLYSWVELSAGTPGDPDRDGRLHVDEMLRIPVRSPLVFLSGCETGVGRAWSTTYRAGEDFATLGQALLFAGAGAVVATLWPISDESAAAFAERFYRHLATASPAQALALAQRELMSDSRFSGTYHWAAYVLIGVQGAGRGGTSERP